MSEKSVFKQLIEWFGFGESKPEATIAKYNEERKTWTDPGGSEWKAFPQETSEYKYNEERNVWLSKGNACPSPANIESPKDGDKITHGPGGPIVTLSEEIVISSWNHIGGGYYEPKSYKDIPEYFRKTDKLRGLVLVSRKDLRVLRTERTMPTGVSEFRINGVDVEFHYTQYKRSDVYETRNLTEDEVTQIKEVEEM